MSTRTLICTFGFDERKLFAAMRIIPYNRMLLVAGEDVLERDEFKRLIALEEKGGGIVGKIAVDPFDFSDCYAKINEAIRASSSEGEVTLNISGGTKVLADAAILAAFQNGVEAFHCDETLVKLPVLKGMIFEDAFSETDWRVLDRFEEGDTTKSLIGKLSGSNVSEASVRKSMKVLERLGVLRPRLEEGQARYHITPAHRHIIVRGGKSPG